jgi:hypothetical protein
MSACCGRAQAIVSPAPAPPPIEYVLTIGDEQTAFDELIDAVRARDAAGGGAIRTRAKRS